MAQPRLCCILSSFRSFLVSTAAQPRLASGPTRNFAFCGSASLKRPHHQLFSRKIHSSSLSLFSHHHTLFKRPNYKTNNNYNKYNNNNNYNYIMSSSSTPETTYAPHDFGSHASWKTNHSGSKGYIPHEDHEYVSQAGGPPPDYYDAATKTFYPTKPIRDIRPSYIKIANQDPVSLTEPQKLLVILDLNGTLFYRHKGNNRSVTPRPYLDSFLDFLFEHCAVMVWSSAQPNSVEAMLGCGFGDRVPQLARIWTREHFRLPRVDYTRKILTIKDLEFVWEGIMAEQKALAAAATAAKKGAVKADGDSGDKKSSLKKAIKYNQTNTVLIDDSKDKSQLQPHNGLVLTDFDRDLARAGTDDELLKVKNYLGRLIYQQNVSAYMRVHPFDSEKEVAHKTSKDTEKDDKEAGDEMDNLSRQLEKSTL